jgi:hypothetical protein
VALGFSEKVAVQKFGEMFQLGDRPEFRSVLLDVGFPADPIAPAPTAP